MRRPGQIAGFGSNSLPRLATSFAGPPLFSYQDATQSRQFMGDQIRTVETEIGTLLRIKSETLRARCPACGREHEWKVREAALPRAA